jgi:hypothetical protein
MSWPTGQDVIRDLLARGHLQQVPASVEFAHALLEAAERALASALLIAASDPAGAYTLVYDGARKSLAAVLQAQGLRPTSAGGHYALQMAIEGQFTKPPPKEAFRSFGRLRVNRNTAEYEPVSRLNADDVAADHAAASGILEMAVLLVPELPVFTV